MGENKCGDCIFLIREDGEPYYCAVRDLYHICKESDTACVLFVEDGGKSRNDQT
jgi:hypothetical protein